MCPIIYCVRLRDANPTMSALNRVDVNIHAVRYEYTRLSWVFFWMVNRVNYVTLLSELCHNYSVNEFLSSEHLKMILEIGIVSWKNTYVLNCRFAMLNAVKSMAPRQNHLNRLIFKYISCLCVFCFLFIWTSTCDKFSILSSNHHNSF